MNSIPLDYVWELDQPLATPAVFVYQQQLQVDADTVAGTFQRVAREDRELLLDRTGLSETRALAALGPAKFLSRREDVSLDRSEEVPRTLGSDTQPARHWSSEGESSR